MGDTTDAVKYSEQVIVYAVIDQTNISYSNGVPSAKPVLCTIIWQGGPRQLVYIYFIDSLKFF